MSSKFKKGDYVVSVRVIYGVIPVGTMGTYVRDSSLDDIGCRVDFNIDKGADVYCHLYEIEHHEIHNSPLMEALK